MKKKLNILLGILLAITVALLIYAIAAPHSDDFSAYDASISFNLIWCYVLLGLAVLSAIVSAVFSTVQNPASIKGASLSFVLIVVVVGVAYFISAGHTVEIPDIANGGFFARTPTVIAETGIIVTYVALVAAILVTIGTEIYNALK
ncbi:MAG TPA: hypothetical protein H9919_07115 [Candidatus Alistipes excrementipullorum]|mgnify:FL=1|nr:hypothetical protein [Candidatus Alistipes excrementipullorum]